MHDDYELCVITEMETVFANTHGRISAFDTAAGTFYNIGKLLRDVSISFGHNLDGLLIISTLPKGVRAWDRLLTEAFEQGWAPTSARFTETGWVTWRHTSAPDKRIHMAVLDRLDQERTPLFQLTASAQTITDRLLAYQKINGALWRMTPGVSGCLGIRAVRWNGLDPAAGREPHWRWDNAPETLHGLGYPIWQRDPAPAERHGLIYGFDIRAQYLAAMSNARLGWGKPTHQHQPAFDPERAGYWRINAWQCNPAAPAIIDLKKIDKWGTTWVTTPAMIYFAELDIHPQIIESWTTATSSQILKPWAAGLRNALNTPTPGEVVPTEAIKRTYAETIGMFTVEGGSIYRPDWRDTIVDLARINFYRKIDKAHKVLGVWPVGIYHDTVYYPGHEDDLDAITSALGGIDERIGKFRYTGQQTAAKFLGTRDGVPR